MSAYPPLPDVPACWSWELPPLPQPCNVGAVKVWQADRCAICGLHRPETSSYPERSNGLVEDHDHATGNTRGFLCPRCNTSEGKSADPVFESYRERYPAAILGVLHQKGCAIHPEVQLAEREWEHALSDLKRLEREAAAYQDRVEIAQLLGLPAPRQPHVAVPVTRLMAAASRVGLTWDEWHGKDPDIPRRLRYRKALDPTGDRWAELFRKELTDWARARREPRPQIGSHWVCDPDEPDNRSSVTVTDVSWGGSEWFVHVITHDTTRWEPAGTEWSTSLGQFRDRCVPDVVAAPPLVRGTVTR